MGEPTGQRKTQGRPEGYQNRPNKTLLGGRTPSGKKNRKKKERKDCTKAKNGEEAGSREMVLPLRETYVVRRWTTRRGGFKNEKSGEGDIERKQREFIRSGWY